MVMSMEYFLVLSCLPEDIRLEWARDSVGKETDLNYLLKFLKTWIRQREIVPSCLIHVDIVKL
jgi:hypothetical protein